MRKSYTVQPLGAEQNPSANSQQEKGKMNSAHNQREHVSRSFPSQTAEETTTPTNTCITAL